MADSENLEPIRLRVGMGVPVDIDFLFFPLAQRLIGLARLVKLPCETGGFFVVSVLPRARPTTYVLHSTYRPQYV